MDGRRSRSGSAAVSRAAQAKKRAHRSKERTVVTPAKRKRHQRAPSAANEAGPWRAYRSKLSTLFSSIRKDQHLLTSYEAEGWKGASREKLKPKRELELAAKRILENKKKCRALIRSILESNPGGERWDKVEEDEDGNLDLDGVFCTRCARNDSEDGNDILLCDFEGCFRAFHQNCMEPKLLATALPDEEDDWFCPQCECYTDCLELVQEEFGGLVWRWQEVFPDCGEATAGSSTLNGSAAIDSEEEDDEDFEFTTEERGSSSGNSGNTVGSSDASESEKESGSGSESDDDSDTSSLASVGERELEELSDAGSCAEEDAADEGLAGAGGRRSRRRVPTALRAELPEGEECVGKRVAAFVRRGVLSEGTIIAFHPLGGQIDGTVRPVGVKGGASEPGLAGGNKKSESVVAPEVAPAASVGTGQKLPSASKPSWECRFDNGASRFLSAEQVRDGLNELKQRQLATAAAAKAAAAAHAAAKAAVVLDEVGRLDTANIVSSSRRHKAVDYAKLNDEMFGDKSDADLDDDSSSNRGGGGEAESSARKRRRKRRGSSEVENASESGRASESRRVSLAAQIEPEDAAEARSSEGRRRSARPKKRPVRDVEVGDTRMHRKRAKRAGVPAAAGATRKKSLRPRGKLVLPARLREDDDVVDGRRLSGRPSRSSRRSRGD